MARSSLIRVPIRHSASGAMVVVDNSARQKAGKPGKAGFGPGTGGGPLSGPFGPGSGGGPLSYKQVALGFHPDLPDFRDLTLSDAHKLESLTKLLELRKARSKNQRSFLLDRQLRLPEIVDLRTNGHFTPVEDQETLGSCTAHAVIGMVEYLIRSSTESTHDLSRLFLYKTTRNLLGWTNDTGAYIRTTIKAMVVFGVPPERDYPYDIYQYDEEPPAFLYSYAQSFKALTYLRLDGYRESPEQVLENIKRTLADGFPVAFGFPVYDSLSRASLPPFIVPFPSHSDTLEGGHAVLAVGYDDERKSLLFRNSWGPEWADHGYAYLPYDFVLQQLATDFWTILHCNWINCFDFE